MANKDLDREVKTRRAEGKVKDLVKQTSKGTPVSEQVRQQREVKTRAAEGQVRSAVKAAASKPAAKPGLMARAGSAVRGALKAARGKAGPLSILALGASASMEAGHALDKALAKGKQAEDTAPPVKTVGKRTSKPKTTSPSNAKAPAKAEKKTPSKSTPAASQKTAYPVYKKASSNAKSFREAFAAARKGGSKEFTWEGRKYNTKLKGE